MYRLIVNKDFGSGVYCNGSNPKPVRGYARSRRYRDAYVDFSGNNGGHSCSSGLRSGVSDQNTGTASGKI